MPRLYRAKPHVLVALLMLVTLMIVTVSPTQAAGKTVTVRLKANAAGLQYWNTVFCTKAVISTSAGTFNGTIKGIWTNGCEVEFKNVPRGTIFAVRVDGQIRAGGTKYISTGAWVTPKAPTPDWWGVVNLGSLVMK